MREDSKFDRLAAFAQRLPTLRRRVARDLLRPGLSKAKVLAAVVRLLETTHIRIGNEEYARQNGSFGLTTLRNHHFRVAGQRIELRFRGKAGRRHVLSFQDRCLRSTLAGCRALPGRRLFGYLDDSGSCRSLGSADVNAYVRESLGAEFSAKNFRTWAATVIAAHLLASDGQPPPSKARRNLRRIIETVAGHLGNTSAVCRKSYVHPALVESYLRGSLRRELEASAGSGLESGLRPEEAVVLAFLRRRSGQRAAA